MSKRLVGNEITVLLQQGMKQCDISRKLNCAKSTVSYRASKLKVLPSLYDGSIYHKRYNWESIRETLKTGISSRECARIYGISSNAWQKALVRGDIPHRIKKFTPINEIKDRGSLKRRLIKDGILQYFCQRCGINNWQGERLSLHLHHKNGINNDHSLENICLLCPNCHSLTETFAGRNTRKKHSILA